MEQIYQSNENDTIIGEPHASYHENSWDKSNLEFLRTNSIRNLHMLWKYLHHLVREAKESSTLRDPYSFMLPDQFCNLTWREFMSWRLEDFNQSTIPYLAMDTKEVPSMSSGMNPMIILMLTWRTISRNIPIL